VITCTDHEVPSRLTERGVLNVSASIWYEKWYKNRFFSLTFDVQHDPIVMSQAGYLSSTALALSEGAPYNPRVGVDDVAGRMAR